MKCMALAALCMWWCLSPSPPSIPPWVPRGAVWWCPQVVCKLFHIVEPDVAVFGRKDYQQWRIITRMVRDLDMPVQVIGVPTAREQDGLAMSR